MNRYKPSFKHAPGWVKYMATDYWGITRWYEEMPYPSAAHKGWIPKPGTKVMVATRKEKWRETITKRPCKNSSQKGTASSESYLSKLPRDTGSGVLPVVM